MNNNMLQYGAPCRTRVMPGSYMVVLVAGALLLALPLLQASYADDFVADAQCVEGHWHVIIYDASIRGGGADAGQDAEDPRESLLSGVDIRTIPSMGSTDVKSTFETDANGSFFLAPKHNTEWVWLSKPGYNDQKVRSSCDTAYDAFSYSAQFASYCYDYVYQAVPVKYLPAMTSAQAHDESVSSIMGFFDGQIKHRDDAIKRQAQEIKALFDILEKRVYENATGSNPAVKISNVTGDALCLLHIEDATDAAYEALGALYVQKSGILQNNGKAGEWSIKYDDIEQEISDAGMDIYCSNTSGTQKTAEEIESGLEALQVLYAELRRQIAEQQYRSLMASLSPSPSYQQPYQQQQQSYYYYDNNYYADDSNYDGANDRRDFYYHDATDSRPYDYGNHDTTRNYNYEDHEDHDHGHGDCMTFCDKDDYEPDWARYLDKHQARDACWDVEADPDRIGTDDWYWCKDLDRYLFRW